VLLQETLRLLRTEEVTEVRGRIKIDGQQQSLLQCRLDVEQQLPAIARRRYSLDCLLATADHSRRTRRGCGRIFMRASSGTLSIRAARDQNNEWEKGPGESAHSDAARHVSNGSSVSWKTCSGPEPLFGNVPCEIIISVNPDARACRCQSGCRLAHRKVWP